MNKTWIVLIAIGAIAIIAFFMLKGGDTKTTTSSTNTTSNQTNGLLGAIADIWGGFGGMFSGGGSNESNDDPCAGPNPPAPCANA